MLVIRRDQIEKLELAQLAQFENALAAHCKAFSPRLCAVLGDEQVQAVVRSGVGSCARYGFTNRGPIRLFVELMFLYGSAFDTDPQFPWMGHILRGRAGQMQRAEQLHQAQLDYYTRVSGPGAAHVQLALKNLRQFVDRPLSFPAGDPSRTLLREMERLFPEKVSYIGEGPLLELIEQGRAEARRHRFTTARGEALMVTLMFAFGHGCTHDLLYPWIHSTLWDRRIADPEARAARLEKKARTWLDHVIAGHEMQP